MPPRRITVVGASRLGCKFASRAARAGHAVTLIDEHPQSLARMSYDAPYFYGTALPAALTNENAIAQVVLESNPALAECFEAGVDLRLGAVAWGAFQNGPNARHIGIPKVGLIEGTGNSLVEHDVLALATGMRDFVPAFAGSNLPGVFGVKAGVAFLDLYQCYEGERTLVLGTSARAVDFVRRAVARGIGIVGMVEPGPGFTAGPEAAAEIAALGIPVHRTSTLVSAEGRTAVERASLRPVTGGGDLVLDCDTICIAIGVLPNIELPAAMGCRLRFDAGAGSWLPETDLTGRTSLPDVFWLSDFAAGEAALAPALAAIAEAGPTGRLIPPPETATGQGAYLRFWIQTMRDAGGDAVTLCKCEDISRADFLGLAPPPYLNGGLRHPHSPVTGTGGTAPRIQQDLLKRMTRVGMGHCQGKRCRDEAALLLSLRFGIGMEEIRPGSYRFPVRPVDLAAIAAEDDTHDTREKWSYWLHEPEAMQSRPDGVP
ncbi:MAG: FAD-dependent oxidoreductase [Rhodobacteraceae bacterium]|nr:FAD-dependent oxidoreductase [Paracoccaceae bacterium]